LSSSAAVDSVDGRASGGKMKILATIHPPEATTAILDSLGLSPRAPPLAAAAALQPPLGPCLSLVRKDARSRPLTKSITSFS